MDTMTHRVLSVTFLYALHNIIIIIWNKKVTTQTGWRDSAQLSLGHGVFIYVIATFDLPCFIPIKCTTYGILFIIS